MTEVQNTPQLQSHTDKTTSENGSEHADMVGETCPEGDYSLWPPASETVHPYAAVSTKSANKAQDGVTSENATEDATPEKVVPDELPSEDEISEDTAFEDVAPHGSAEGAEAQAQPTASQSDSTKIPYTNAPPKAPPPPPTPPSGSTDSDDEEAPMSLLGHLTELRSRLLRMFISIGVCFLGCYAVAKPLFYYLALPLIHVLPSDSRLMFTGLPGGFFVELKVAFVAGIFAASPYIFYQIWSFIAPGLYSHERRYIIPLAVISAVFFLGGASFCYFVVFPFAFTFFVSYASEIIVAMPSINEYLSLSLQLLIAFGLIFEMPLFAFFLARMGILTATRMRSFRRYAILGIFVVAAIMTPPDIFSQLLMALPMFLLYELSIIVAAFVGKKDKASTTSEEKTS